MSLVTVVRDVCAVVGVAAPTSVIASINTNRTMFEMLACANEMAQRIAYDTRDWTELRKYHTLIGADHRSRPAYRCPQTVYPLPADYKRMLLNTNLWRSTQTQAPLKFVDDPDDWLQRRLANDNDAPGSWTKFGDEMHLRPGYRPVTASSSSTLIRTASRWRAAALVIASWPTTTASGSTSGCSSWA